MATQILPERNENSILRPSAYFRREENDDNSPCNDNYNDNDSMIFGIPQRPRSQSSNASIDTNLVYPQLTKHEKMIQLVRNTIETMKTLFSKGERYFILYSDDDLITNKIICKFSKEIDLSLITIDDGIGEQQKDKLNNMCITRIFLNDDCISYESTELLSFYSSIKDEKYTIENITIDPLKHVVIITTTASIMYELFHNAEFSKQYEDQFLEKFNSFNCIVN